MWSYCAALVKDKLGDHKKVENYRGITLTPVISKLFESVALQLTENKLQTDDLQFGLKKALAVQMLYLPLVMLLTILHT